MRRLHNFVINIIYNRIGGEEKTQKKYYLRRVAKTKNARRRSANGRVRVMARIRKRRLVFLLYSIY